MSFYLDTNAIYSFIFGDSHSARMDNWLQAPSGLLIIGDYVQTEFHALVGRRVRGGGLTSHAASVGIADFDAFLARRAQTLALSPAAGALAVELARDPSLKLSAPDALHLACAAQGDHVLVTFDQRLADAARVRAYPVEMP
jgi:predicted nucleic acid-binding protein